MSNPKQTLLQNLQDKTITQGWDVLVAYNAASINDLFAAQFVTNTRTGQNLPPLDSTMSVAGSDVTVQFEGVTLGPPLISFDPTLAPQTAKVTMYFVAGEVLVASASGKVSMVTGAQTITPGTDYALIMTVNLAQVSGGSSQGDVVVDLRNANTYEC